MAILVTEDVPCMMFLYFTVRVAAKHISLVYVYIYVYLCIYAVGGSGERILIPDTFFCSWETYRCVSQPQPTSRR
jgi:hypothetical protein